MRSSNLFGVSLEYNVRQYPAFYLLAKKILPARSVTSYDKSLNDN